MRRLKNILLTAIFLNSCGLYSQNDFGTEECDYEVYHVVDTIQDGIEFFIEYTSVINMANENCTYSMAENYHNIAPDMQTKTLCVIYVNQKEMNAKMNYLSLFDTPEILQSFIDNIQFVFITDKRTRCWETYSSPEEIRAVFDLNIRTGIKQK